MTTQDRLVIFDTTLRDGEQAPGCTMTLPEKLRVAEALSELKVDVIEAGFPAASPGDFEAVQAIASEISGPVICGLARSNEKDISRAFDALKPAGKKRLHVFIATSPIHREFKLEMDKASVLSAARDAVLYARELCDDVEFSAEDAMRTEPEFLAEVVEAAIGAGATTINLPDTVGYIMPQEISALFESLRESVPGLKDVVLSAHCHDDLGLAAANSLAAVSAGARQIECTINGLGERAGNCSLEEVVMAVKTRPQFFDLEVGINTQRLFNTSRLVSDVTGMHVARNKAIVGSNAFAHEAGIHQHGMLKHSQTYEIMRPQDVGISSTNLVLGKHSGRHALRQRVEELGFHLDQDEFEKVFEDFKNLADRKKEIVDADLEALILNTQIADEQTWQLAELQVTSSTSRMSTAAVKLISEDLGQREEAAVASGPIEAAFAAIERAARVDLELVSFDVRNISDGEDSQGEVTVIVKSEEKIYRGRGVSTDIIEAGAYSLLQSINRIEKDHQQRKPAPSPATA